LAKHLAEIKEMLLRLKEAFVHSHIIKLRKGNPYQNKCGHIVQ